MKYLIIPNRLNSGSTRFDVFAPEANSERALQYACHLADIIEDHKDEIWGCLNFFDHVLTEELVLKNFPKTHSLEWRGDFLYGIDDEYIEALKQLKEKQQELELHYFSVCKIAETKVRELESPKMIEE